MIASLLSAYSPAFVSSLVYMLQSTEYQAGPYVRWFWRTDRFDRVMYRRTLEKTTIARVVRAILVIGIYTQVALGIWSLVTGWQHESGWPIVFGLMLILGYPLVWAHLIVLPVLVGRKLVIEPKERRLSAEAKAIFANSKATIIAVAGSYGKTTIKELLAQVLGAGLSVAATPGNKNVAVSHAQFAKSLTGREDVLIIEYGEGKPGDVQKFAENTHPSIGIITGLAPAHLDHYITTQAAGADIMALAEYLTGHAVYVNADSGPLQPFIQPSHIPYSQAGVAGWKVQKISQTIEGLHFNLAKGNQKLNIRTGLLGRHLVGPVALAAVLALQLGVPKAKVLQALAAVKPYQHRLEPRAFHGAWLIDDTYNGNIEGMRVGLALLQELPAKRRVYITPGLVDQGIETETVHLELGKLIAQANPDVTVLMANSVTGLIQRGLEDNGYTGEVMVESDPLPFYSNLEAFVAAGDVVLLQNDWTDNYA